MKYPPYWNKTITLYHREIKNCDHKDFIVYKRQILHDCFYRKNKSIKKVGNDFREVKSNIIRIPLGCFVPSLNDVVVFDTVNDEIDEYIAGKRLSDLQAKYSDKCFIISSIHDNSDFVLPHYFGSG